MDQTETYSAYFPREIKNGCASERNEILNAPLIILLNIIYGGLKCTNARVSEEYRVDRERAE